MHGVDAERASLSALGHDLVRHLPGDELLALAARYGLQPDAIERAEPILVHGPVAARMLVGTRPWIERELAARRRMIVTGESPIAGRSTRRR